MMALCRILAGRIVIVLALAAISPAVLAQAPAPPPDMSAAAASAQADIIASERFRRLAAELRCLVCQNQSLADSTAPLAQDLRNEVVRLIQAGDDDSRIKTFLVDRYGEFVLYRPALSARNALLWFGPFLLLAIGALAWRRLGRQRLAPGGAGSGAAPPGRDQAADAALDRVDRLLER